jgi:hypothetical protein
MVPHAHLAKSTLRAVFGPPGNNRSARFGRGSTNAASLLFNDGKAAILDMVTVSVIESGSVPV